MQFKIIILQSVEFAHRTEFSFKKISCYGLVSPGAILQVTVELPIKIDILMETTHHTHMHTNANTETVSPA